MANKAKRDQIVALKTDGITWMDIVKQFKVCQKTVDNARKQFQESTSGKSILRKMCTVRTKTLISETMKKIEQNP